MMCVVLVASLTEEMAAQSMLMEQQTVTNLAVIHGLCAMTLAMHCLLRLAPTMINHLTSN